MPIFDRLRVLFVHIPKTGGDDLERYLCRREGIEQAQLSLYDPSTTRVPPQHYTWNELHTHLGADILTRVDMVLSIVRNPYQRCLSDLFHLQLLTTPDPTEADVLAALDAYLASRVPEVVVHRCTQASYLEGLPDGALRLLHTETLTRDMEALGFVDYGAAELRMKNRFGLTGGYERFLTPAVRAVIARCYAVDFQTFGYDATNVGVTGHVPSPSPPLRLEADVVPPLTVDDVTLGHLELMRIGAYGSVRGFMRRAEWRSVLKRMRLLNGQPWAVPIVLPVGDARPVVAAGAWIRLCDERQTVVARGLVVDVWAADATYEAVKLGIERPHPHMARLEATTYYVGVQHLTFAAAAAWRPWSDLRATPADVRASFRSDDAPLMAFQTRNPLHAGHVALIRQCLVESGVTRLLLHPTVGPTQATDVDVRKRVRSYRALVAEHDASPAAVFGEGVVVHLAVTPLPMAMLGPREAVHHAIVRRGYGATHFIVGRDHAGPTVRRRDGTPFFDATQAWTLASSLADEMGIRVVTADPAVDVSGTAVRQLLTDNQAVPPSVMLPSVSRALQSLGAPTWRRGLVVAVVGVSAAGKSTLVDALTFALQEHDDRQVTVLDGDVVRQHLCAGLGFSAADKSRNVRRIGWVAAEVARHGGTALVANIAPYAADRRANRAQVEAAGGRYVQIWLRAPLDVVAARDPKGLYQRAQAGLLKGLTGFDEDYEDATADSDLVVDARQPLAATVIQVWPLLRDPSAPT
jgi:sulfate adenylyltransferase